MGFAAGGGTCTSQQSVTADAQPEDNPTTTLTATDQCIIAVRYQRSSDPLPPRDKDCKAGDNCTPIIVQLDGRTLKLTAPEVFFDLAGWGTRTVYSWTEADSLSGFLVYSRNGNGEVNDGRDLFGNSTPLSWTYQGSSAPNGFSALAFFDLPESGGNSDGWIDKYDQISYDLRLWFDRNHDGISQPEELMPLHECGVEAIELTTHESNRTDAYGNVYHLRARVILDAAHGYAARFAWDVTLAHQ